MNSSWLKVTVLTIIIGPGILPALGRDDPPAIAGTWVVDRGEGNGQRGEKGGAFVFADGKVTMDAQLNPSDPKSAKWQGTYSVDPKQDPPHLTMKMPLKVGDRVVEVEIKCIYRLKGDTLEICAGTRRPTEFTAKKGSDQSLWVCTREGRE